jgi:hypothetical protein
MSAIRYGWPWLGLAAAVVCLAALLLERRREAGSRWRDPSWLVCLMLPVYMLHQFEEHGINLRGEHYHFLAELCAMLGRPDLSRCPADPVFVLAVNCGGGVWIPGLLAIFFRRRNPMVGACAMGIPLVNAVFHIGQAVARGSYNSGLATAALLFVPMCAWTLAQLRRSGLLEPGQLASIAGSGLLLHAVLIASVLGRLYGILSAGALVAINVADGIIPLVFAWRLGSVGWASSK